MAPRFGRACEALFGGLALALALTLLERGAVAVAGPVPAVRDPLRSLTNAKVREIVGVAPASGI